MSERAVSNILSGLICLLLGTVIFVVLITGQKSDESSTDFSAKPDTSRILKVITVAAKTSETFNVNRIYSGVTKAKKAVDLSFASAGRVDKISFNAGEKVKKDEVLAELDSGTKLVAPFEGTIASKRMSIGTVASPGVPVLRLIQSSELEAWFSLPIDVTQDMNAGDTYQLSIAEENYQIVASGVLPEIDENGRTRTVYFKLPKKISDLHLPGETIRLEIARSESVPGYWLPVTALTRETRGMWSIFVVKKGDQNGDLVERRFVEVHHVEDDRAWIKGTIGSKTRIIAEGTHRVVPGQRVQAVAKTN